MTTTIVLADDHAVMRSGLAHAARRRGRFEVVAEAGDVESTVRYVRGHKPNVLILDLNMPGGPALDAVPDIVEASPKTRIVVLTMQNEPVFARRALQAGAVGYVLKEAADDELVQAVRQAAAGRTYLNPEMAARVATAPPDDAGPPDGLTEREVEVLTQIALGYTNTQIAERLYLSVRTVETHRSHIQQKLRRTDRSELVQYALDHGLRPGRPRLTDVLILLTAASATALATGLGAIPVFFLGARAAALRPALWGLAAGLMTVASFLGLLLPAIDDGTPVEVLAGLVAGIAFLLVTRRALGHRDVHVGKLRGAGVRRSLLVFLVLLAHSLPEGLAIGTAYASEEEGLGLFVILAIALQNVPEGTSVAIPMHESGFSRSAQFWAAVGTSAPQPVGALIAYALVEEVDALLPLSFAFAAGRHARAGRRRARPAGLHTHGLAQRGRGRARRRSGDGRAQPHARRGLSARSVASTERGRAAYPDGGAPGGPYGASHPRKEPFRVLENPRRLRRVEQSRDALAFAERIAVTSSAELVAAKVYERYVAYDALTYGDFDREARAKAKAELDDADLSPVVAERRVAGAPSPSAGLDGLAREIGADLIVVGSTHRGPISRVTIGSTGERLLHGAPCSVAVAPRGYADGKAIATIGVAFDGGAEARRALVAARELAVKLGAGLHLISVVEPIGFAADRDRAGDRALYNDIKAAAGRALEGAVEGLPDGVEATSELVDGKAVEVLVERSRNLDLLVCGSRGYGLVRQVLLGGVSAHLVNEAECPVLVCPRGVGDREAVTA